MTRVSVVHGPRFKFPEVDALAKYSIPQITYHVILIVGRERAVQRHLSQPVHSCPVPHTSPSLGLHPLIKRLEILVSFPDILGRVQGILRGKSRVSLKSRVILRHGSKRVKSRLATVCFGVKRRLAAALLDERVLLTFCF
jgi:hypothetical protein